MMFKIALKSGLVLVLFATLPLAAQTTAPASALKGHNTNAPIDVAADRIEVRDADNQAIFSGSVSIKQAGMTLDADSVKVFYKRAKGASPEISRIDAQGNVRLVTASETATGRYGIYDVTAKAVTLVGNVVLKRGESLLTGQRLAIDLGSGRSTMDSASGGQSGTATPSGRVTGRFVVPQRPAK